MVGITAVECDQRDRLDLNGGAVMKKLIMSASMTIVLAGAVAGCAPSSTASPVSAQSALATGVSGPASPAASGASSSGVSMPAQPTPADTSPAAPTPPVQSSSPAVVTPTSTPAIGAHAVATIGTAVV